MLGMPGRQGCNLLANAQIGCQLIDGLVLTPATTGPDEPGPSAW